MQKITMSYLINYLSCMPFSLSLFSTSISLSSTCMSLWLLHCWQSQNSEQLSPGLTQLHLFIYLFIIYLLCTVFKCICSVLFAESHQMWFLFQLEARKVSLTFLLYFSPNHIHMDSVGVEYQLQSFPTWLQHSVIA